MLLRRIIELAGLKYQPAAPVTCREITEYIKKSRDVLETPEGEGPHTTKSTSISGEAAQDLHQTSPLRSSGLLAHDIDEGHSSLPMVKLHEALLYKDQEQERLARSLTKAVIETACNARNYDMILLIITLMPRHKDVQFSEAVQVAGSKKPTNQETNLLCWAVKHRQLEIIARLIQLGVDVNAPEPKAPDRKPFCRSAKEGCAAPAATSEGDGGGGKGLTALMLCVQWLSKSQYASLAMESLACGKDEPYITVRDIMSVRNAFQYKCRFVMLFRGLLPARSISFLTSLLLLLFMLLMLLTSLLMLFLMLFR